MNIQFDAINEVVNADAIENGAWLHLKHPTERKPGSSEGKALYMGTDGKLVTEEADVPLPAGCRPMRALVRSVDSKKFRSADLKHQTKAMSEVNRAKLREKDDIVEENTKLDRPRRFAALLITLENVSASELSQTPADADKIQMALDGKFQWLVNQVMEFAYDGDNFGIEKPKGESKGNVEAADENP